MEELRPNIKFEQSDLTENLKKNKILGESQYPIKDWLSVINTEYPYT